MVCGKERRVFGNEYFGIHFEVCCENEEGFRREN